MQYIAYDNNKDCYLCRVGGKNSNKYSTTNSLWSATIWEKENKAKNIVKALGKNFAEYSFEIQPLSMRLYDLSGKANDISNADSMDNLCVCNKSVELSGCIELGYDILEKARELEACAARAEARLESLKTEMSKVDLEVVDIEHAAEFYNLNAAQGYKLYKMLHDARVKRRDIKNEMEKLNHFLNTTLTSNSLQNLQKSIAGMKNRKYTPRVNNELFGV